MCIAPTPAHRNRSLRSNFTSSRLVRLLGDWVPLDAPASGMDFAERMSLWFNAFDAIRLQGVHQSIRGMQAPAPGQPPDPGPALALAEHLQRVRATLAQAIQQGVADGADAPGYAPYHRRHLELQRRMELAIAPLRDQVRQALGRASRRLRQLAALDAAFEEMLAPREQLLLPVAAALLQQRFEQLRLAHRQEREAAGQPDDPADWSRAGGWLQAFGQDWRQALLAELELRLEPVAGLIDALSNESDIQQR